VEDASNILYILKYILGIFSTSLGTLPFKANFKEMGVTIIIFLHSPKTWEQRWPNLPGLGGHWGLGHSSL